MTAHIHIRKRPLAANEIICPVGETVTPEVCLACAYHVMGCYYGVEFKV